MAYGNTVGGSTIAEHG